MLTRQGVYSREEILSRHEVHIEKYCKVIRIEAGTLVDMVQHGILNAVSEYEATLCNTIVAKHTAAPELTCHVESSLANAIGSLNEQLLEETIGLKTALETVSESFSPEQLLHYYHDEVEKRMDDVRRIIDKLEVLTASKYWPYPTFCELLFSVSVSKRTLYQERPFCFERVQLRPVAASRRRSIAQPSGCAIFILQIGGKMKRAMI